MPIVLHPIIVPSFIGRDDGRPDGRIQIRPALEPYRAEITEVVDRARAGAEPLVKKFGKLGRPPTAEALAGAIGALLVELHGFDRYSFTIVHPIDIANWAMTMHDHFERLDLGKPDDGILPPGVYEMTVREGIRYLTALRKACEGAKARGGKRGSPGKPRNAVRLAAGKAAWLAIEKRPNATAKQIGDEIGCSAALVVALPAWKQKMADARQSRQRKAAKEVPMTPALEASLGRADAVLAQLAAEQSAEDAQDERNAKVYRNRGSLRRRQGRKTAEEQYSGNANGDD